MKGLFKNTFIFLGCEILSKSVPFLMLPYLTRVLDPEGFGQLGLFTSLQALMIIAVNFSFENGVARYYYRYGKRNYKNVLFCAISLVSFFSLLIIFCVMLYPGNNVIILYATVASMLQSIFNILLTSQQCRKNAITYAGYQISFALLSCILTVIFFHVWGYSFKIRIDALIVSFILIMFIALLSFREMSKISLSASLLKTNCLYLIVLGFPLIIHQLSLYVKGQFDRIIVADSYSYDVLAGYAAAFQIASVLSVIIMALNKALIPFYFESCKNGTITPAKIKKIFLISIPFCLIPGLLSLFLPDALYGFILGGRYSHVSTLVSLFMLGFGLQIPYLLAVNYLFYRNQNKKISSITFTSSACHLIFLLIFRNGMIDYLPCALVLSNTLCIALMYFIGMKGDGFENN